ncbi:MAG: hypothetical protein ACRDGU_02240 [Actinomycetota bacterium]
MATNTTRVSKARLQRIRWQGESSFRVLSYYCTVRWNRSQLGNYILKVLGGFAVDHDPNEFRNPPTPGYPPRYSVLDLGTPKDKRRYRLLFGDEVMITGSHPGDVLTHLFWHINSETFQKTGNFLLVHAGAVATPAGEGILLPADSGSGKSTLTAALVQAGFRYLSDEAGAIDPVTRRLYPYPKALSFKKSQSDVFADLRRKFDGSRLLKRQWHLRAEDLRPEALGGPCQVRYVIAPQYEAGADIRVTPMSRAEASVELARCALNLRVYRERALPLLADVSRGARAYRLRLGDLREAVEAVAGITGMTLQAR